MTIDRVLAPAASSDLDALWPAVRAAHIFPDRAAFDDFYVQGPWRVLLGSRGAAAVVERWRDHLDILAIRGVWASSRDLPGTLSDLRSLAGRHGYAQMLSPLVSLEGTRVYERAGLHALERLVAYRASADVVSRMNPGAQSDAALRIGCADDLPAIDAIDRACFAPFWAYGPVRIAEALAAQQIAVAELAGQVIGYTLSTVERGSGTLGRIAVLEAHRRRGVGAALLVRSAMALVDAGAGAVSLCTQEANATARSLYTRFGMREVPGKLLFLIGDVQDEGRP